MSISYLTNSTGNVDYVNSQNGFTEDDSSVRSAADLNFENFLTLLVTELEQQDPLNPMDNKEMTAQLAQFSSLEQNIQQNEYLEKLAGQSDYSQQNLALSYIGKEALIPGDAVVNDPGSTVASLNYVIPSAVTNANIEVMNESGEVVRNIEGSIALGRNTVTWDGTDDNGDAVGSGYYSFKVSGVDPSGEDVSIEEFSYGYVYSMEGTGDDVIFTSGDGREFTMDDVLLVREPVQYVTSDSADSSADDGSGESSEEEA
ncbi:MAG: flagellar biosynthesis protein FlgD [Magnetococcales bacterium]|nr:flagellar biosynthesis protein FlgD [Magnetococcales bacterium]PPR17824.1 MAG: Basal-body rod modification protein FlgD [Pseudomonadota bacterium]|tara:strand:- start:1110 stop:1883 length:774 start_codon:yes stop_codon:yes gene_type:complete